MWLILGNLDGNYVAPDGKEFENVQLIARVSTRSNETPWQALSRQAREDTYIAELLNHRSKGRWESITAYELTGTRLEPDEQSERVLESIVGKLLP